MGSIGQSIAMIQAMQLLQRASSAAKGLRALQGLVLLRMARLHLDREEPWEGEAAESCGRGRCNQLVIMRLDDILGYS